MNYGFEIICASIFTGFCLILARIYSLLNRAYTYWDKRNVNGPKPAYIFGTWEGITQKFLGNEDYANSVKYGKVYGTYDGLTPNLAITDPDLIKEVLVSSADSFQGIRVAHESSMVLRDGLLSICGEEKSDIQILMNSLLNPHKLDKVIPKLESAIETLIDGVTKERQEDGRLNITSCVSDFVNEAIALAIFGNELNADIQFKDNFVKNTQQIFNINVAASLMSFLTHIYPNYFKAPWVLPEKSLQYFVNLIISGISQSSLETTTDEKKESNLIELLVEAAEEEKKLMKTDKEGESEGVVLTDNVIISKCIASMLTLTNATRTTVLLGLYALANNDEVQDKLYKEIEKNKAEKLSYEEIQNLNYLDKVVKEVFRLYPFEFRVEKVATSNVKIGQIELDKNVRVSVPLYALHRSEDLYPEPEKFDPERFSQNASEKRSPFTYLPFGQAGINGSDISIQLGVLVTKLTLFRLVEKFKFFVATQSGLHCLFKKGFTRVPQPEPIEIMVEMRN